MSSGLALYDPSQHADVAALVIAEINKDLTRHPVGEIEKHLTGG